MYEQSSPFMTRLSRLNVELEWKWKAQQQLMKTSLAQFASPPSQQVMAWALRYTISTLVLILNGPQEFSYMSFFSHVLYTSPSQKNP